MDNKQVKRWRRNLAEERAEEWVYRQLAARSEGVEQKILLELAEAEKRHQQHWESLLGEQVGAPVQPSIKMRLIAFLAKRFGSIFALALMQYSEQRASAGSDADTTLQMAADEAVHGEVMRALAAQGRAHLSGNFRAAVFGANDGLVSNLALVIGVAAAGASSQTVVLTGFTGLLAGALSMAAGEYVSVSSQRELLEASAPDPRTPETFADLDINANEIELVFLARGMEPNQARSTAAGLLAKAKVAQASWVELEQQSFAEVGHPWQAAISSFWFFAFGALVPVLPFLVGISAYWGVLLALLVVGIVLLFTGGCVGLFSGTSPARRAFRQLAIGYAAAGITYGLGLLGGALLV